MAYYKGDEIKFAINLEAPGFSMEEDDFDVEVIHQRGSAKGYKDVTKNETTEVVIFKETEGEGDDATTQWYTIVDTANFAIGNMRVVATAYIKDANANDGIRKNIAVAQLGKLVEP